jgi:protein-S-isoprenylcysteine O-methyltransferase Ste14
VRKQLAAGKVEGLKSQQVDADSKGEQMTSEPIYRIAFFILFILLLAMRITFMVKIRRSGGRIMPDEKAIQREGGRGYFIVRVVIFFALITFLMMYFAGAGWIIAFSFSLPPWLRWIGFAFGVLTVFFWTWVQVRLDTQWSPQLQLTKDHQLITSGPYARIRHPLYAGMCGWFVSLSLLTANWIFVAACSIATVGIIWRIPKEEKMMIEAFGDEYKAYMQRTGRFFPKLNGNK